MQKHQTVTLNEEEIHVIRDILVLHLFGHPTDPDDEGWKPLLELEPGRLGQVLSDALDKFPPPDES